MAGEWNGSFSYPDGQMPTTPFQLRMLDAGGRLTGTVIETNTMDASNATIEAWLAGTRSGRSFDFTKSYPDGE